MQHSKFCSVPVEISITLDLDIVVSQLSSSSVSVGQRTTTLSRLDETKNDKRIRIFNFSKQDTRPEMMENFKSKDEKGNTQT